MKEISKNKTKRIIFHPLKHQTAIKNLRLHKEKTKRKREK